MEKLMNIKRAFLLGMAGLLLPAGALMAQTEQDTFTVQTTKIFSDGSTYEVDVTLTCNTGLPLEQTFTIAGGDADGVTFVVTDFADGSMNCEVTESGAPAGYSTVMNGGDGCAWTGIELGDSEECQIENTADDATYTVVKDWTVQREGGDLVIQEADVTIECDSAIDGGWEDDGYWYKSGTLGDGDTLVASVDVSGGSAECSASETILQSGVESSSSGCGPVSLGADGSHTCTFTNTVFFEGIPTLSQYGLAILVLLTLGVGFVGFRRFV
jgi:hypothetical protein